MLDIDCKGTCVRGNYFFVNQHDSNADWYSINNFGAFMEILGD
ncbi:MAG: hypothetical protein ACFE75_07590 [Candidatus Hodarchaeota archaeon]